jgi:hypothetical protein
LPNDQVARVVRKFSPGFQFFAIRERSSALPAMNQHVPTDERKEQQQVRADDGYAQRERRFRQLYEKHYLHIQAYAVRRLDVQADVADVVAEVFPTAWRRLDGRSPGPGGTIVALRRGSPRSGWSPTRWQSRQ